MFGDEFVYLNSFTFYNISPAGFTFQFINQSNITLMKDNIQTLFTGTVANDSCTTIVFDINSANSCSFYMDIFSANKTIYARSTKGCDFSSLQNEKQYIG